MTNHDRLTQLVHRAAEDAAPESLDLWPRIAAEVDARRTPRTQQPASRRSWIALVAGPVLVAIALLVGAFLLAGDDGDGGIHFAALGDSVTPTVSPEVHTATPTEIPVDAFVTPGTPVPANLIATVQATYYPDTFIVSGTPVPADMLDPETIALEAVATTGRFQLRETPSNDAAAILVTGSAQMEVLEKREVAGESWYRVRARTTYGPETGWVNGKYVHVRPAEFSDTPLSSAQLTATMIIHNVTATSAALTDTPLLYATPRATAVPPAMRSLTDDGLEAIGTVERYHLREAPSDDAPALALLQGRTSANLNGPYNLLRVLDQREVAGELWYQVRTYTAVTGLTTGWVKSTYVQEYAAGEAPLIADSGFVPAADVEPLYTTYHSTALDLTFDAPAGWTPYEDPALNRDELGTTAISFYETSLDMRPLSGGAPEHGAALVILRIADISALELSDPGGANSARLMLGAVIGENRLPPSERLLTFYTSSRDDAKTLYLLIAPPGESTSAYLERFDHVLESAGIWIYETTDMIMRDFVDGIYTHSGVLTHDEPRRIYTMEAARLTPELLAGDGWVLAQVDGAYRTPLLSIDHADQSFMTFERYASGDGAVLFRIPDGTDRLDFFHFNLDGYYVQTHGDYTFSLRPVTDTIAIGPEPQTITLAQDQPVVLRFDLPDDDAVRLQIDTLQAMSMEEMLSSRMMPQPEVKVLLPYGETLASYKPRRSDSLNITFMPPMQGQQYIVLNPVDLCLPDMTAEDCAAYTRSDTTLSVSITPASSDTSPTEPSAQRDVHPPTLAPLADYTVLARDEDGILLAAETGTPVHATGTGTVVFAGWLDDGLGNTVIIAHGDTYTIYGHLSVMFVDFGDSLTAGNPIGTVGSTGNTAEPALRFELRDITFNALTLADWVDF